MSDTASRLAEKLASEGEKTLAFFKELPDNAWTRQIFADGAQWDVRGVFEHLTLSEASLRKLFENVIQGGEGTSSSFDVDGFNRKHTGRLAAQTREQLFEHYARSRQATVAFTRLLSDEQLALRGWHPALGDSSVEGMIKMIYLHHTMHMHDVKKALQG
jgi:hypothetical protein